MRAWCVIVSPAAPTDRTQSRQIRWKNGQPAGEVLGQLRGRPLLVQQSASQRVDAWFGADDSIAIWTLTPAEVTSALWRLVREGALGEEDASRAEARAQDVAAASYTVVDVDTVAATARRLLRVHALRAADSLQLGAALIWAGGHPQNRTLHTFDERLALAARREGFAVP